MKGIGVKLNMNEHQYELLLNIRTRGVQQGFPKLVHYHRYEPTPYTGLEQLLNKYELPNNPKLIDIGCGKGRVPIFMHYRFQMPVTGIEMDGVLYWEAELNKAAYLEKAKKRGKEIVLLQMLAQNYKVLPEDNVFFFFNPFSVQIFRKVVNNILRSLETHSRIVDIILYYPSKDYLQFLIQETSFDLHIEVRLENENHINERFCVFRYNNS